MIIKSEADVTPKVLSELQRAENPRFKQIMEALVRHLHAFARDVRLTEEEFQQACAYVNAIGKASNETHNEAVLMAGSLGLSPLVCLLNNGNNGQTETTANMLGPFWRPDQPRVANDDSIIRSPTPGDPLFAKCWVKDTDGKPVAGAEVDVWQSSTEGFYENQDPGQAEMNLRGKFTTDANGYFGFRSILPAGYPIPVNGPVGEMLRVLKRHNMRPAHIHFLIKKDGFKTHISQVYVADDPYLETDVQFGVTEALIGNYIRHENEKGPAADVTGPWYSFDQVFKVEHGVSKLPRPPITAKAEGSRPVLEVINT